MICNKEVSEGGTIDGRFGVWREEAYDQRDIAANKIQRQAGRYAERGHGQPCRRIEANYARSFGP
jgi:hypothetical protein